MPWRQPRPPASWSYPPPATADAAIPSLTPPSSPTRWRWPRSTSAVQGTPLPSPPPPIDVTAPSVSITSPADGATVARRSTVTIRAGASDDVGVTRVEFYVDGRLQCSVGTAPYTCAWSVPPANKRSSSLYAVAFDAAEN